MRLDDGFALSELTFRPSHLSVVALVLVSAVFSCVVPFDITVVLSAVVFIFFLG